MSGDEPRPPVRRPRKVMRAVLPAGPVRDLRDAVYLLYGQAGAPQLETMATTIAADDNLPGSPSKDQIREIVSGDRLGSQQDTVTVAVALARATGRHDTDTVAGNVRRLWEAAWTAEPALPVWLGRPVGECDPLALEVHPAIEIPGSDRPRTRLPEYVVRAHDLRLRQIAAEVITDGSRLVTLVGASSTGKTRACWELAQHVDRQQPDRWRLWHPYDPTRPEAAASAIDQVGPYTIIWLNEAQYYLAPTDERVGERIAAGLRTLLHDPSRAPVLVLATLWPAYWTTLTTRPSTDQPDLYGQTRDLLVGTALTVAETFTQTELAGLAESDVDPRLQLAAAHAEGGRVTQYLAGAPELENRYDTAPAAVKAIIQVAVDACRLGHPPAIPHALLEQAAPGYLDDHDWDLLSDDWLDQALAYAARPCNGARGPLTRIRARPGDPPAEGQHRYRLADYLEQTGRRERAAVYPPDSLWTALIGTSTDPDVLRKIGRQAEYRGRYQHAIWLFSQAAKQGDTNAVRALAGLRWRAGDAVGAEALYWKVAKAGDATVLRDLADLREEAGDAVTAQALAIEAADYGDIGVLRGLAKRREQAGDSANAQALATQAADRGDTGVLRALTELRERAGDAAGAVALAVQAADRGDVHMLRVLAERRHKVGDAAGSEALYRQAADRGDTHAMRALAWRRERAGDAVGAETLYRQAAECGDTQAMRVLAGRRERAGDVVGAVALAIQAADRGNTSVLTILAGRRERVGDAAAETLYRQAADRGDAHALLALAEHRRKSGDVAGAEGLYRQAADHGDTRALRALAWQREQAGDVAGAEALIIQAVDRGNTNALWALVERRDRAGDTSGADVLAIRAADRGNTHALRALAKRRNKAGETSGAEILYRQAADRGDTRALLALAWRRERAGDADGAETLATQAANGGNSHALRVLAWRRERAGDAAGAESLYRKAVDRGDTSALQALAKKRAKAGDDVGSERIRRFGLTGAGEVATQLDFSSYDALPPEWEIAT